MLKGIRETMKFDAYGSTNMVHYPYSLFIFLISIFIPCSFIRALFWHNDCYSESEYLSWMHKNAYRLQ